jgi:tRNA (guanine37-N1)-methyltransferase
MHIDVVTLFPEMVEHAARVGVVGRALERQIWQLHCWNPRDYTHDPYRRVDDRPFGGGPGMVMKPEPLAECLQAVQSRHRAAGRARAHVVHVSPRGSVFRQADVSRLVVHPALVFVCSRYEAVDQRLLDRDVDEELSLGDFVISGGELAALVVMDALVRSLPGVMTDPDSVQHESFIDGLLEGPHYTRPEVFAGQAVPEVLRSGHHAHIARWRREQSLRVTAERRPDLLAQARQQGRLSAEDEAFLRQLR